MSCKLRIGEVAELFAITTKTLRHYEELGLLCPDREENGYRLYNPEDVLRVQRIRQLQSLGVPLKEAARLLEHDDEIIWEGVLRSLREEAASEIDLLQERLERIEQLLGEGLPPNDKSLPAPPDKVNEYLEQNLAEGARARWQRDTKVYASLQAALGSAKRSNDILGLDGGYWLPGQALLIPPEIAASYRRGTGNGRLSGNGHNDGEWAILRALRKSEHLIEALEEER